MPYHYVCHIFSVLVDVAVTNIIEEIIEEGFNKEYKGTNNTWIRESTIKIRWYGVQRSQIMSDIAIFYLFHHMLHY